jgi:hypothetical protein
MVIVVEGNGFVHDDEEETAPSAPSFGAQARRAPQPRLPRRPLLRQEEDFEVDFEEFGVKAGDSELDSTDEAMTFAAPGAHSPEDTTGSSQSLAVALDLELSLYVTPFLVAIVVPLEEKTSTVDWSSTGRRPIVLAMSQLLILLPAGVLHFFRTSAFRILHCALVMPGLMGIGFGLSSMWIFTTQ